MTQTIYCVHTARVHFALKKTRHQLGKRPLVQGANDKQMITATTLPCTHHNTTCSQIESSCNTPCLLSHLTATSRSAWAEMQQADLHDVILTRPTGCSSQLAIGSGGGRGGSAAALRAATAAMRVMALAFGSSHQGAYGHLQRWSWVCTCFHIDANACG
jgi:hypothetical protein